MNEKVRFEKQRRHSLLESNSLCFAFTTPLESPGQELAKYKRLKILIFNSEPYIPVRMLPLPQRHGLSRWVFFGNQGEFDTGDYVEIMNKASCLSLVSNAILYWNTVKIGEIVDRLRQQGETIDDDDLAHISPLRFRHVRAHGTYFIDEK